MDIGQSPRRGRYYGSHDYSWGKMETNPKNVLGEDAIDWKYAVCDLSEVFCLRAFCEPPPMMVGLTIKASSPMTFHFDTPS